MAPIACKRGNRTYNPLPQTTNFITGKKAHKRCEMHDKSHGNTEGITRIKTMPIVSKMDIWITRYSGLKFDRWTVKNIVQSPVGAAAQLAV